MVQEQDFGMVASFEECQWFLELHHLTNKLSAAGTHNPNCRKKVQSILVTRSIGLWLRMLALSEVYSVDLYNVVCSV